MKDGIAMKDRMFVPTRTLRYYLSSSLVWKDFLDQGGFLSQDILVADPFKAGTTWTQRILQQILDNGEEREKTLSDASPWLDSSFGDHARMLAMLRQQRQDVCTVRSRGSRSSSASIRRGCGWLRSWSIAPSATCAHEPSRWCRSAAHT
jgi:hypothetical protein